MESTLEKFEKILDEIRVIRDLDEFKSNSPKQYEELLENLTKLYEDIIKEAENLTNSEVTKADELMEKLINAQPELEELKEKFEVRKKVITNLKGLDQVRHDLLKIDDLTNYRENFEKEFDKSIESIIRCFSEVSNNVDKDSEEYYQAAQYIKEICNKHPELKQFEKLFLEETYTNKTSEEKQKEITEKFELEKSTVKVTSLTNDIEKLRKRKETNSNELGKYKDLIEKYTKEIFNNENLSKEEKQKLISQLEKDNQILNMLEVLAQQEKASGGPSL